MTLRNPLEIRQIEHCGRMLHTLFRELVPQMLPGTRALDVDGYIKKYLARYGLRSVLPLQYPASACISVNEVAAHGVPNESAFRESDVISVDVCFERGGWIVDGTWSYAIGGAAARESKALIDAAWRVARAGLLAVREGVWLSDIAAAIADEASRCQVQVFSEFCGHGIGRKLHERPRVVHVWQGGEDLQLKKGLVFTVEPIVTFGSARVEEHGWEFIQVEGRPCAQFEHLVAICDDVPRVVSLRNIFVGDLPTFPLF